MAKTVQLLASGFKFPEGPRWHEGKLWFSDQHGHRVYALDGEAAPSVVAELEDMPSGLGFLPDGGLLISAMRSRRIFRYDATGLRVHADLSGMGEGWVNDMVVDGEGRAYIGFTFGQVYTNERSSAAIVLVGPDGRHRVVTDEVSLPNGSVITPDGLTLIVGESGARRLTAFDIASDGSLSCRRTFAEFEKDTPDGCCLDAEGAIWMAAPRSGRFIRVRDGGDIVDEITVTEGHAIACALGGAGRRTLFLLITEFTSENFQEIRDNTDFARDPEISRCEGRIETVEVGVQGAGWP
jgi:sugar lactone lactonase YvrE